MGAVGPFKDISSASIICLDIFRFNHNSINIYLSKIISLPPLAYPSPWQSHTTIFVTLNSIQMKYILTFRLVVILTACVYHCITEYYLVISFSLDFSMKPWKYINYPIRFKSSWTYIFTYVHAYLLRHVKGITRVSNRWIKSVFLSDMVASYPLINSIPF